MSDPAKKVAKLLALALDQVGTAEGDAAYQRARAIMVDHELDPQDLPHPASTFRDSDYERAVMLLEAMRYASAARFVGGAAGFIVLAFVAIVTQGVALGCALLYGDWLWSALLVAAFVLEAALARSMWRWFSQIHHDGEQLHVEAGSLPGIEPYKGFMAYRPEQTKR